MGTATSWMAVEGATLEQLATHLPRGPAWEAAILPGGWALAMARMQRDGLVAESDLLARLSRGRRVVVCDEESHVMYAASAEWRDGRERWAVIHASETAADHLVTRPIPIARPRWWLLREGWVRGGGAIGTREVPGKD